MARFVKVGKVGSMINVEQITAIYPNEKSDKYTVCMTSGNEHYVTYDEFLEITGQRERQSNDKKYRVKFLKQKKSCELYESLYLGFDYDFDTPYCTGEYGVQEFTQSQIEKLKKRDDIAIDWDKVELEEVDDA